MAQTPRQAGNCGIMAALVGLAGVMGVLLALAGCGVQQLARGEIEPPRVEVKGVRVGFPEQGNLPVLAALELTNPNGHPLEIRGYDYELRLEGRSVARGASSRPVHLPAWGRTRVEFPILVQVPAVLSMAPLLLGQQKVTYQLAGGFRLGSVMGGLVRVPFAFQGQATPEEGRELLRLYTK